MSPLLFVLTAVAGGLGAVLRWVIEVLVARRVTKDFPFGIMLVNVLGTFALGVLTGTLGGTVIAFILGTGFLGGFTTFSSVSAATALMLDQHRTRAAVVNAGGTFVLTVCAALLGLGLGTLLR